MFNVKTLYEVVKEVYNKAPENEEHKLMTEEKEDHYDFYWEKSPALPKHKFGRGTLKNAAERADKLEERKKHPYEGHDLVAYKEGKPHKMYTGDPDNWEDAEGI